MEWLIKILLDWVAAFVGKFIAKEVEQYSEEKEIDEKKKAAAEAEKKAVTKDELDKADNDLIDHV